MNLLQSAAAVPGWSPPDYARTAVTFVVAFGIPALLFCAAAIILERRAGPQGRAAVRLALLWGVALATLETYLLAGLDALPGSRWVFALPLAAGSVGGLLALVGFVYGVPFAAAATAAWGAGRAARRAQRRPGWAQIVITVGAYLVGWPLAIVLFMLTGPLWDG